MVNQYKITTTLTILSLEDSYDDFRLLNELLLAADFDFKISRVENEEDFVSALTTNTYDVILADFNLPQYNAFEALKKATEICPDVPFICVSGSIGEETAIELIKQGADDYILKDKPQKLPYSINRALLQAKEKEERKLIEQTMSFLLTCGLPGLGEGFFESLARYLSANLDMEYVCIDSLEGDGLTAQTLAVYNNGSFESNVKYTLKDTPCGKVVDDSVCCFPKGIQRLFPNDLALLELNAESYVGTTLTDSKGEAIGLIAIIGHRELADSHKAKMLLKLVSPRAAGELERLKAEELLQKSEVLKRKLVTNIGDVIVIISNEGTIKYKSPNIEKLFGWKPDELIGKSTWELIHPEDLAQAQQFIASLFSEPGKTGTTETRYRHSDGSYSWIEFTGTNLMNDPDINGILGNYHDITERKKAEKALEQSKALLTEAEILTSLGSWEWDVSNDVAYWSEGLFNIFKLKPEKEAPNWAQHNKLYVEEDFVKYAKVVEECIRIGTPYTFEIRAICSDGEIKHCIARGRAANNAGMTGTRLWGTLQDITIQKNFERALIEAKEHAEESDRLKTSFLANMSHEIRTPLNSIIGFSELIIDPDFEASQHTAFAQMIHDQGNNLLTVLSDIMDISKIEAGQMQISKSCFSVNQFVITCWNHNLFKAEKKGLDLKFDPTNPSEEIMIHTDSGKMNQILTNLVVNAIKFTEKGFVEIGFKKTGDFVQFHVKDTGIGIPKNYHEQIFDRFRQVDSSYTRKTGGNGLGLAISKNLVEMLGGRMWVESEVGKGSTFYFTLPKAIKST